MNLVLRNSNPNPSTICNDCKLWIGHVFIPGSEPPLPRHFGCFCFYAPTPAPPTFWEESDPDSGNSGTLDDLLDNPKPSDGGPDTNPTDDAVGFEQTTDKKFSSGTGFSQEQI
jgi:hypothetical protein